jgi:hypothetical protein
LTISESYQKWFLINNLSLFILYEHMRIIGNPFMPNCQEKNVNIQTASIIKIRITENLDCTMAGLGPTWPFDPGIPLFH